MNKKTVLAISGSLRSPSFTEKMLDLCIEGMGGGVEVNKFYPHKMNIGPCTSCWSCWGLKSPGVCAKKDDFGKILDVYKRADYFLWAFPLYFFSFPATVKNVIDRFFIMLEPSQYESSRGTTEHPKRFNCHPKTVLISSCGFPEIENFDIVRQNLKKICLESDWPWAGEILISAAGAANVPHLFDEKYELIKKAGRQLFEGAIDKELSDEIAAPVMDAKDYRAMATASFSGGITGKIKTVSTGIKAIVKKKLK
jgi:putative NADPH-quinone reductase